MQQQTEIELGPAVSNSASKSSSSSSKHHQDKRVIHGTNLEQNRAHKYHKNRIKTSKYNVFTFLPLNLFEQFHRFANLYYLFLIVLQSIPLISSLSPITTVILLAFVLSLTAVKDLVDDINRHRSDRKINNREAFVLRPGATTEVRTVWKKLEVGEVVLIKNNQPIPADMLLLSTSDDNGLCFVDTQELDGETNLKVRQALVDTQQQLFDQDDELAVFDGLIECEAPNNNLNRFEGRLEWQGKTYSLNNENILLRGCTLRNTAWAHGIIVFAGKDSKLMKNSGKSKLKSTRLDALTNRLILCIFGLLALMMIVEAINCYIFESTTGRNFKMYSYWVPQAQGQPALIAIFNMFSFLMLIQTLIPISLYISIEIIRFVMSRTYINSDLAMYHEPLDTPAVARTTTLNEELGQIEYIFTDKTGTLTQNIMTFNKCSINGYMYGNVRPPRKNEGLLTVAAGDVPKNVDFSKINPQFCDPTFQFFDWGLAEEIEKGNEQVHEFFKLIALCHTVIADTESQEGKLLYQAQSPDEAALVGAARNFGFVYKSRSPTTLTINVLGVDVTYELLCVLDFDNVRKRMSVIVRDPHTGRRQLLCKGADTLILSLLDTHSAPLAERTRAHLSDFAVAGLRTLCCAVRDLDDDLWANWSASYHEASTSLENREQRLAACFEDIEKNLRLIGATAVEDKLQVGVPETIFNLAKAGIKIWVLTGDKQETAINIGYSCSMLDDTMEELIVDAEETLEDVRQQLMLHLSKQQQLLSAVDFALIINGPSLMHALKTDLSKLFLEVACTCKTVICCRVTPLQKAQVVELVKQSKQTVTLAIGDGANDVNMIKTAHIGVGISGQEGMQAVLSSDFSFAQFRYLQRLLLVHGRWAYLRIAIFLRYFFYKNFALTACHVWYGIYSGWSAYTIYDQWFIMCYNLIYTALPIICYGWFEQDVNIYYSQSYPQLYQPGLRNALFNLPLFLLAIAEGLYDSVLAFFVIRYGFSDYHLPTGHNILSTHSALGIALGTTVVVVVTIRCLLEMSYLTVTSLISVFIVSLALLFVVQIAFAEVLAIMRVQYDYYRIMYPVWASPNFWLCMVVILFAALLPILLVRSLRQIFHVPLTERVRTLQRIERKTPDDYDQLAVKRGAAAASDALRRSNRFNSSYAFSQQAGMGELIQRGILHEGTRSHGKHGPSTSA